MGFGDVDDIIKGLMASLSVWHCIISRGCKEHKAGDPPIQLDGLQRLKELVYFILYFEIEL